VSDFFQNLIAVLQQEEGCYRELKGLAVEQKAILVSGKLEGLQENVRQQEKIMFNLGPMSETRQRSMEGLGKTLGLKSPTMSDLATTSSANRIVDSDALGRSSALTLRKLGGRLA